MTSNTQPLRHIELMLVRTFILESLQEIEASLNETAEEVTSPDWQYLKGQQDLATDLKKHIDALIVRGA